MEPAPRYVALDPELRRLRPNDLEPAFVHAVDTGDWSQVLEPVGPRVHRLRVFTLAWCQRLDRELAHYEAWARRTGVAVTPPNTMHDHGVVLAHLGLTPLLDELVTRWLRPLAAELYPDLGGATLDEHHAYLVDYHARGDLDLAQHVDNAEVTLNLCLGGDFEGSELRFFGMRCPRHWQTSHAPDEEFAVPHEPGVAIVHAGSHRHEVDPLIRGRRRNLIVWCRSSVFRAAGDDGACPAWCGHGAPR